MTWKNAEKMLPFIRDGIKSLDGWSEVPDTFGPHFECASGESISDNFHGWSYYGRKRMCPCGCFRDFGFPFINDLDTFNEIFGIDVVPNRAKQYEAAYRKYGFLVIHEYSKAGYENHYDKHKCPYCKKSFCGTFQGPLFHDFQTSWSCGKCKFVPSETNISMWDYLELQYFFTNIPKIVSPYDIEGLKVKLISWAEEYLKIRDEINDAYSGGYLPDEVTFYGRSHHPIYQKEVYTRELLGRIRSLEWTVTRLMRWQ